MVSQDELQELMGGELKTYFHDQFLGTEQLARAVTQTGEITEELAQLRLSTGIQEGSTARANYNRQMMNPLYSKLYVKLRMNDMRDLDMFVGFKYDIGTPSWGMTTSCAGLFMDYKNDNSKLYWYTGNGDLDHPKYQAVPISGIDTRSWHVFKMEGNRVSYWSVPYTVPYFDKNVLPGLKQGMTRKWSQVYACGSVMPADVNHYLMFWLRNRVGATKYMDVEKVNYAEVYPD